MLSLLRFNLSKPIVSRLFYYVLDVQFKQRGGFVTLCHSKDKAMSRLQGRTLQGRTLQGRTLQGRTLQGRTLHANAVSARYEIKYHQLDKCTDFISQESAVHSERPMVILFSWLAAKEKHLVG